MRVSLTTKTCVTVMPRVCNWYNFTHTHIPIYTNNDITFLHVLKIVKLQCGRLHIWSLGGGGRWIVYDGRSAWVVNIMILLVKAIFPYRMFSFPATHSGISPWNQCTHSHNKPNDETQSTSVQVWIETAIRSLHSVSCNNTYIKTDHDSSQSILNLKSSIQLVSSPCFNSTRKRICL
jgi:hypothetical protein